ncbi:MAG: glycosyltransferase [Crocinitomicaceae bacterium]|nr:glycosyltransferase [Crocinitomicaceae bacterium]|tara:strand:- start:104664 stop:105272 length:609 start_codon:yes stop_codon:yes gene_type:complete
MSENLIIVFVKNATLGKVKTRLAKAIGDYEAFNVYQHLFNITESESLKVKNSDLHIYFSDKIIESVWPKKEKFIQSGNDLGERMMNAFEFGFKKGYKRIIGIGSDLPDLKAKLLDLAIKKLEKSDTVLGPSNDGGYYLIGMKKFMPFIFQNKPWSTNNLLKITTQEILQKGYSLDKLTLLNDIDNIDDLKSSSISKVFQNLF